MVILLVNDFSAAAINLSRSSSMASWAAKSLRRRFILSVSAALKLRWFAIFSSSVWRLRVFFFKSRICLSISLIFRSRDVLRSSLQRSSFSTSASNCFAVFSALSAIIAAFWFSKKGSRCVESNASGRSSGVEVEKSAGGIGIYLVAEVVNTGEDKVFFGLGCANCGF